MKKVIKILLIVLLCFVVGYGIKILYGLWIWHNVSSSDQLKIAQSAYEKCVAKGKEGCESYLDRGIKKSLGTQKEELMASVLDKTKSIEDRLLALDMFYIYCRNEDEFLSKEEAELYFFIANNKEEPEDLRAEAAKYLLQTKSKDEIVSKLQTKVLEGSETSIEYKRAALEGVAGSDDDESIDALIKALGDKDEDTVITLKAGSTLKTIGPKLKDKIPQLLEIALDEGKILTLARTEAIDIIGGLARDYGIKDQETIKKLEPLVDHNYYSIRSAAAKTLEALTGKKYEVEEGTEADLIEEEFGLVE